MSGPPNGASNRAGAAEARTERNLEIWRMRVAGHTQAEIAEHLGISQPTVSGVLAELVKVRNAEAADALRAFEAAKLDADEAVVMEVLCRDHYVVQGGKIVRDEGPDGEPGAPLLDSGPVLAAIDRRLKIAQRRAALLGLDMPTKIEAVTYDYRINGIDVAALR